MKKIGIYSGTFDPIHKGHIAFATEAQEKFSLDKVFLMVEPQPRRKQGVRAVEHRTAMVSLAIADHKNFGQIILQQPRFTPHETLPVLAARFKGAELFMLMGDDMLLHLAEWPHIEELVNACGIIIGIRNGSAEAMQHKLDGLKKIRSLNPRYEMFKAALSDYSSSKIRAALRKGKIPTGLHPGVIRYIQNEGLYVPGDESA